MPENKQTDSCPRVVGFDFLRLLFIFPMVMMHVWNVFRGEAVVSVPETESLYPAYVRVVGGLLGFSGIYIFALSFFLFGYLRDKSLFKGRKQIFRWVIFGISVLSMQFGTSQSGELLFIWDIFSFVLLSLLLVAGLRKLPWKVQKALAFGSIVLLCFPPQVFSVLEDNLLPWAAQILLPSSSEMGPNGWFLLPWIGLPILTFTFGSACAQLSRRQEIFFLILFLVLIPLSFFLGSAIPVLPLRMTSEYYIFSFRQHPAIFWRYFLPVLCAFFVFTRPIVNSKLQFEPLTWLSKLQWNRNFWFAYAVHFGLLDLLYDVNEVILARPALFDILWIWVMIGTEVILQLFFVMLRVYKKGIDKVWARLTGSRKPTSGPSESSSPQP